MTSKIIEILDRDTFIPALVIRLDTENEKEKYLLKRAGYGDIPKNYILLVEINGGYGLCSCDVYDWDSRSLRVALSYLYKNDNFDRINPGEVIDIEYILGESEKEKESESKYYEKNN